jgi:hypothetical protein
MVFSFTQMNYDTFLFRVFFFFASDRALQIFSFTPYSLSVFLPICIPQSRNLEQTQNDRGMS